MGDGGGRLLLSTGDVRERAMPLPLIEALWAGNSEATLIFTEHKGFCMLGGMLSWMRVFRTTAEQPAGVHGYPYTYKRHGFP